MKLRVSRVLRGHFRTSGDSTPSSRLMGLQPFLSTTSRRPPTSSFAVVNLDRPFGVFKRVPHDLFKFTTADEMYLIPPSKGGEGVVSVTDRPVLSIRGQPPGSQGCRPPLSRGIFRELPIFSEGPLPAFRIPTAASRGLDSDTEDIAAPFLQPGGIAAPIDHGGADPSIAA